MPPFVLRSFRWIAGLFVVLAVAVGGWPRDFSAPFPAAFADEGANNSERQALRQELHRRAEETTVYQIRDGASVAGQWIAEPLFRYSDQPRDVLDAALWAWVVDGRPIAFQKVEAYRETTNWRRIYCLASLSPDRISVEWPNRSRWSAKKPGVVFRTLPQPGEVAESNVGRLLQMRRFARRFSATIVDEPINRRQEMRLLPQPIFRYAHPQSGLIDGAVFSFATNATAPDALLTIELQQPTDKGDANTEAAGEWRYALTGMTKCGLSVRFDGKEVWSKEDVRGPGDFENWLYFVDNDVP
jgi:hypothetical protein